MAIEGKLEVIAVLRQLVSDWRAGPPSHWENRAIPAYLEAMAAWLEVYEQAYINTERPIPAEGWTVVGEALEAAAAYE